jgi:hypothetical protein
MNEETLLVQAMEKPTAERAQFLEEACAGDLALRDRLKAMLDAHGESDSLVPKWDVDFDESLGTKAKAKRFDFRLYFALLAISLAGSLAILPYSYSLMKQMNPPVAPEALLPLILAVTVIVELLLAAVAIGIGLGLGPPLTLARMIVPLDASGLTSAGRRIWEIAGKPLAIGMVLGVVMGIIASKIDLEPGGKGMNLTSPSAWEGLLASIGAGTREEIWLRLGLMTLCAWVAMFFARAIAGQRSGPTSTVIWIANVLAALAFAAIHIPQAYALLGLTVPLLIFIFVGNGVPGLVFGWLYWRRGLIAAMIAHFGLDLVLKVFIPLLS